VNDRLSPITLQLLNAGESTIEPRAGTGSPEHQGPQPPYYVVIFTSLRNGRDRAGYALMAEHMVALAARQPGYLGMHTARGADGLGITVSYWRSEADILAWRQVSEHRVAQQAGQDWWYAGYELQIARVERAYARGAGLLGSPLSHATQGAGAPVRAHPHAGRAGLGRDGELLADIPLDLPPG
jgi:heme-degrading monooxygenase HmoA